MFTRNNVRDLSTISQLLFLTIYTNLLICQLHLHYRSRRCDSYGRVARQLSCNPSLLSESRDIRTSPSRTFSFSSLEYEKKDFSKKRGSNHPLSFPFLAKRSDISHDSQDVTFLESTRQKNKLLLTITEFSKIFLRFIFYLYIYLFLILHVAQRHLVQF